MLKDNTIVGGFGSAVSEFAVQNNLKNDILIHGIPDRFIDHAKPEELYCELKLDDAGIAEIAVEELQKNPLCPFVILWVAGAYFPVPIKTKTNFIQLFFKSCNIFFGGIGRVLPGFNGILFGRQTKAVKAHRMQYIKPF